MRVYAVTDFATRFWSKVARSEGCWEWTAGRNRPRGYGLVYRARGAPSVGAHRAAWELTHGPIPEGMCVCHHCDNPPCVRPSHLFLGTHRDNKIDSVVKGRASGNTHRDRNAATVLSDEDVRQIRCLARLGVKRAWIARCFGVVRETASRIALGQARVLSDDREDFGDEWAREERRERELDWQEGTS